jgi:RNA polymerase sigma-70 factor (ECF subfamily)
MSVALLQTLLAAPSERGEGHAFSPTHDEDAERALVARLRAGEEQAFRELMQTYFVRLARFVEGIVRARDIADDIAQDVLASVWEQRAQWAPTRSIKTYLFGAARNRALNELRHHSVRARHAAAIEAAIMDDAEPIDIHDRLSLPAAVARLRSALARLPEHRRTALRLRYDEGLTYPAIAGILGMSVKSAEQLVALTVRALRKQLLPAE